MIIRIAGEDSTITLIDVYFSISRLMLFWVVLSLGGLKGFHFGSHTRPAKSAPTPIIKSTSTRPATPKVIDIILAKITLFFLISLLSCNMLYRLFYQPNSKVSQLSAAKYYNK